MTPGRTRPAGHRGRRRLSLTSPARWRHYHSVAACTASWDSAARVDDAVSTSCAGKSNVTTPTGVLQFTDELVLPYGGRDLLILLVRPAFRGCFEVMSATGGRRPLFRAENGRGSG